MYTNKQRIAIARIVSDMIKADNIIEESEIQMLNRFKELYQIDSATLYEARRIKFSTAVQDLATLDDDKKIELFNILHDVALADNVCVPREALLLLALQYTLGIVPDPTRPGTWKITPTNGIKLIACPTGDNTITTQYVIYIEGQYNAIINRNIRQNLEHSVLKLREWGFDFIYIPALIDEFREMNAEYVKNVIQYMAPELSNETIETVYGRLLRMDTISFCNHVLAENLHVDSVKDSVPSLFINIGTSFVPYYSIHNQVECYTEFLCIPLSEDIMTQIHEFTQAYCNLVSFRPFDPYTPVSKRNYFKYFGFYKAMFDFLVKAEPQESDLILHPWNSTFEFPGAQVQSLTLAPQEAALYKLILECTYNRTWGGLPTTYTKHQRDIEHLYATIYHNSAAPYPDNLAPIRSRIERKMREQLIGIANLNEFIPKLKDGMYQITARPERIKISDSKEQKAESFIGYHWK
jgi:hypothetical protein